MEPINGQERTNATIRFMALFFITMLVVVVAVFFDQIVGKRAAADNGENFRRCMGQLSSNEQFTKRLNQISAQLSNLNKADNEFAFTQAQQELNAELTLFKTENAKLDTASSQFKQNLLIYSILSDFGGAFVKQNEKSEKLEKENDTIAKQLADCKEESDALLKKMATMNTGAY
jgi:hypothetical protein